MILESYLDIFISAMLAYYSPYFIELEGETMNGWDKMNFGLAVGTMVILLLFTVLALYLFCMRFRLPVLKERNQNKSRRTRKLLRFYKNRLDKERQREENGDDQGEDKPDEEAEPFDD